MTLHKNITARARRSKQLTDVKAARPVIVAFAVVAVALPPLGAASEEVLIAKDVAELAPGQKGRPVVKLVVWMVRVLVVLAVT
jgi:hypothetical protein